MDGVSDAADLIAAERIRIAVIGAPGAGKTTLLKMLCRETFCAGSARKTPVVTGVCIAGIDGRTFPVELVEVAPSRTGVSADVLLREPFDGAIVLVDAYTPLARIYQDACKFARLFLEYQSDRGTANAANGGRGLGAADAATGRPPVLLLANCSRLSADDCRRLAKPPTAASAASLLSSLSALIEDTRGDPALAVSPEFQRELGAVIGARALALAGFPAGDGWDTAAAPVRSTRVDVAAAPSLKALYQSIGAPGSADPDRSVWALLTRCCRRQRPAAGSRRDAAGARERAGARTADGDSVSAGRRAARELLPSHEAVMLSAFWRDEVPFAAVDSLVSAAYAFRGRNHS